jgi:hypothetical protein
MLPLYYLAGWAGIQLISLPPGNLTVVWFSSGIGGLMVFVAGRMVVPLADCLAGRRH